MAGRYACLRPCHNPWQSLRSKLVASTRVSVACKGCRDARKDSGNTADTHSMSIFQKSQIIENLTKMAVPMDKVPFTKEAYAKLFPRGTIKTPIGTVKLGDHQFERLQAKGREHLLGAIKTR
ncbi:MAG: hypothetical protein Ta2A_27240 [Treponemataceae bacterium]|nr:MAG: hypothetical protein Ta2A_27240 [Treponemataceae bacterium]